MMYISRICAAIRSTSTIKSINATRLSVSLLSSFFKPRVPDVCICCAVRRLHNNSSKAPFNFTRKKFGYDTVLVRTSENMATLSMVEKNITPFRPQNYDYFLVVDFEATCLEKVKLCPQEIIEFPVLKVSSRTFETESVFHHYVKPVVHPELSPFCTQLTGIVQDMIEDQPDLSIVLKKFHVWMEEEGLLKDDASFIFVSCGDWDLNIMLPSEIKFFDLSHADYFKTWINIKKSFFDVFKSYPKSMMSMLAWMDLTHVGRHHSGIDDCKNIASIVKGLAERGIVFGPTGIYV